MANLVSYKYITTQTNINSNPPTGTVVWNNINAFVNDAAPVFNTAVETDVSATGAVNNIPNLSTGIEYFVAIQFDAPVTADLLFCSGKRDNTTGNTFVYINASYSQNGTTWTNVTVSNGPNLKTHYGSNLGGPGENINSFYNKNDIDNTRTPALYWQFRIYLQTYDTTALTNYALTFFQFVGHYGSSNTPIVVNPIPNLSLPPSISYAVANDRQLKVYFKSSYPIGAYGNGNTPYYYQLRLQDAYGDGMVSVYDSPALLTSSNYNFTNAVDGNISIRAINGLFVYTAWSTTFPYNTHSPTYATVNNVGWTLIDNGPNSPQTLSLTWYYPSNADQHTTFYNVYQDYYINNQTKQFPIFTQFNADTLFTPVTGLFKDSYSSFYIGSMDIKYGEISPVQITPIQPVSPTILSIDSGFTVSFNDNGANSYTIQYKQIGASSYTQINIGTATSYTVTGLTNNVSYLVNIISIFLPLTTTRTSQTQDFGVTPIQAANDPTNLTISRDINTGHVILTWSGTLSYHERWQIFAGTTSNTETLFIDNISVNTYDFYPPSPGPGQRYYFYILGQTDSTVSNKSNEVSIVPDIKPSVPLNFALTPGTHDVLLTWNPPATGYDSIALIYKIYGAPTGNTLVQIGTTSNTNFDATGLISNTSYSFYIIASTTVGNSNPTSILNTTTLSAPNAPTNLSATTASHQVNLTWSGSLVSGETWGVFYGTSPGTHNISGPSGLSSNNASVVGLTNGTTYYFIVRGVNNIGVSSDSNEVAAIPHSIPNNPTLLNGTISDSAVSLSWTGTLADDEVWQVYSGLSSGTETLNTNNILSNNATISNLNNGQLYWFYIKGYDLGLYSSPSNEISLRPDVLPSVPLNFALIPGDSHVNLVWNPPATGGTSLTILYKIYGAPTGNTLVLLGSTSNTNYDVTGLSNNNSYSFYVTATTSVGTGPQTATLNTTPNPTPTNPTSLVGTPGNTQVTLNWSGVLSLGETWAVFYGTSSGNEIIAGPNNLSVNTATITGLTNTHTYYFIIRGISTTGQSQNSNEISLTPNAPPPAITSIFSTPGNTQGTIYWNAPGDALQYNIYQIAPTNAGLVYTIPIGGINGQQISHVFTNLTNGVTYTYYVTTQNSVGVSAASPNISVVPNVIPPPPTGLIATPGDTQIFLKWDAITTVGQVGYHVYDGLTSGGENLNSIILTTTGTTATITGLTNGVTYYFVIKSFTSVGESGISNEVFATPNLAPAPPTNLRAWGQSTASIYIEWTASITPNVSYTIFDNNDTPLVQNLLNPYYLFTGLLSNQIYTYRVRAYKLGVASTPTNDASASPQKNEIWVNNYNDSSITILDTNSLSVITTLNHSNNNLLSNTHTWDVKFNLSGDKVYVTNDSNFLVVFNSISRTATNAIAIGNGIITPKDIAINQFNTKILVANSNTNKYSIIDSSNNTLLSTPSLAGTGFGVAYSKDGKKSFIGVTSNNTLLIVDNTNATPINTIVNLSASPYRMAVSTDGTKLYITHPVENLISIVDTTSYTLNSFSPTLGNIPDSVCFHPIDLSKAYISYRGTHNIGIINITSSQELGSINVGNAPTGLVITPDGIRLLVCNSTDNTISVVDLINSVMLPNYTNISVGQNPVSITTNQCTPADFTLTVNNFSISAIQQTPSNPCIISLKSIAGFSDTIHLSMLSLPSGITAIFSPTNVLMNAHTNVTSSLTFVVDSTVSPGVYNLTILANPNTINTYQHSININLVVTGSSVITGLYNFTHNTIPVSEIKLTLSYKYNAQIIIDYSNDYINGPWTQVPITQSLPYHNGVASFEHVDVVLSGPINAQFWRASLMDYGDTGIKHVYFTDFRLFDVAGNPIGGPPPPPPQRRGNRRFF